MDNFFKCEALTDWHKVTPGESLLFPSDGPRRVRLYVSTNDMVEVWAGQVGSADSEVLCAYERGQFSVEFTADGESFVRVLGSEDAAIFVRGAAPDHRVPASGDPAYVSIAPRSRRNSDMDRMIMLMRFNEQQREARYQADFAALQQQLAAQKPQTPRAEEPVIEGGGGAA